MNGSDNAAGRQGPASSLPRGVEFAPLRIREDREDWPWEATRPCVLCRIARRPQAPCEYPGRILEILEKKEPERPYSSRPPHDHVCKDCCIVVLDGHDCLWWDLCWRD